LDLLSSIKGCPQKEIFNQDTINNKLQI